MVKKFRIVWGKEEAIARLLEDEAPKTCEKLWDLLPYQGRVNHGKISGGLRLMVPFFVESENTTTLQDAGDIFIWPNRQVVAFHYEEPLRKVKVNRFAVIVENLEGIKSEGKKCWEKQGSVMKLEKIEVT